MALIPRLLLLFDLTFNSLQLSLFSKFSRSSILLWQSMQEISFNSINHQSIYELFICSLHRCKCQAIKITTKTKQKMYSVNDPFRKREGGRERRVRDVLFAHLWQNIFSSIYCLPAPAITIVPHTLTHAQHTIGKTSYTLVTCSIDWKLKVIKNPFFSLSFADNNGDDEKKKANSFVQSIEIATNACCRHSV